MTVDLSRKQTRALGTEVTLDTNGENEGFEVDMDRIPKIIEYCDDDTEDMQKEKGAAGGIPIMNIINALEVEPKDSKVKSNITINEEGKMINNIARGNEKNENTAIIRHDNHEINGVAGKKYWNKQQRCK